MQIQLATLREGVNLVEETVLPEHLGLDVDIYDEPIKIKGELDNTGSLIDTRLKISARGRFICDRCTVKFDKQVEVELRLQVIRRDARSPDEEETEGLIFAGKRDSVIDLSRDIYDAVCLDQPMQVLCRPECKGLCYHCGQDLNEGPCECDRGK